ncbi:MAG: MotA/TolQ/ExbB proton channel family protein, partial [Muribaculaceae bacterium]|nr:MotA/TolQ/ExbB proton channel family protein [Muribaculaceae bacterium]
MVFLNSIPAQNVIADSVATIIDSTATNAAAETACTTMTTNLSIWELCLEGGFIMIPLALLSILALYIFIERAITIHKATKYDPSFMNRIKDYVHDGEIESAQNLCKANPSPVARL